MWRRSVASLVNLVGNDVPELGEDLALPLLPLLATEHGQCALLVRGVDLVLLTETDCLHAAVTRTWYKQDTGAVSGALDAGDGRRGWCGGIFV